MNISFRTGYSERERSDLLLILSSGHLWYCSYTFPADDGSYDSFFYELLIYGCFTFVKLPFDQDKSNLKVFSIITMLSQIDKQELMGRPAREKTNANHITRK